MIDYVKKIYVNDQDGKSISWCEGEENINLTITDSSNASYYVVMCREEAEVLAEELMNFVNYK
tara:strand:- start:606 stop:794 length:189 start_codon:yes stop_codon:yes gene_type:complete